MKEDPKAGALDLVAKLSLPEGSRVPDPADGRSTEAEYDRYFRIVRDNPDLIRWTRTCLDLLGTQLADLAASSLDWQDKSQILEGMLLIQRVTLEKWVKVAEGLREEEE